MQVCDAERPIIHLRSSAVPLVSPGEHEDTSASASKRRPDLPVHAPRLLIVAVAERVEPELAQDQRTVARDVLEAREVRLERRLTLEIDVEADEIEKRQFERLFRMSGL